MNPILNDLFAYLNAGVSPFHAVEETAARLEANAPGGKILISRAVADALGERARVTSLGGSIKLKGKAEGFETLTLDALNY